MTAETKELFEKIRRIQIDTVQLVDDILAGMYHSAFKGQGMEFEEVREYQQGDEIRSIDWKVTARMGHPYVKVFREERELTVMLLVDISASSRFGSQQKKRDYIAEIGAVLAFSAIKNNDKVGLILFSSEVELYIPPKKGLRHVLRVVRELLVREAKNPGTDLEKALRFMGNVHRKRAVCFLVSDFICPLEEKALSIASKLHDLITINVTDPHEIEFPEMELATVTDIETGESAIVDTNDPNVREAIREAGKEALERVEKTMQKVGAGYIDIRTNASYLSPLQKFFKLREVKH